jgi:hypothetical protein
LFSLLDILELELRPVKLLGELRARALCHRYKLMEFQYLGVLDRQFLPQLFDVTFFLREMVGMGLPEGVRYKSGHAQLIPRRGNRGTETVDRRGSIGDFLKLIPHCISERVQAYVISGGLPDEHRLWRPRL